MLRLWGCIAVPEGSEHDTWDGQVRQAWLDWTERFGPAGAQPMVDSATLRKLINRDAFQEYIVKSNPIDDAEADEEDMLKLVEVKGISDDGLDMVVEAVDQETGEMLEITLREEQEPELRRRLEEHEDGRVPQPVLARVDLVGNRITEILPLAASTTTEH